MCGGQPPLCSACYEQGRYWFSGPAGARGAAWAERVYGRLGDDKSKWPTWPPYQGKARGIAERKVEGLTHDPRLAAELARRCYDAARDWYERARLTSPEDRYPYR